MLTFQLLKNHAGIVLCGDYQTFTSLHEVIHDANDRSPIIRKKEGWFLGLAYDVRKAYEGQRRTLKSPDGYPEIGPRFGVEILWPVLLLQARMLRASMGFIDTTKHMQSHAYALEGVIEEALREDFGGDMAARIIHFWEHVDPAHPAPEERIQSRGAAFCSWTKAQRKNRLAGLLASLDYMYAWWYEQWQRNGDQHVLSPAEYTAFEAVEWPDPRW